MINLRIDLITHGAEAKGFLENLKGWQDLLGAMIGAFAAFLVWFTAEKYRQHRDYKDRIYSLERILVDRINTAADAIKTIENFVDIKLVQLKQNIQNDPSTAYSIDHAFFPLFSIRPIDAEVHKFPTKSGYIDNKVAHAYNLSEDIPLIINDLRRQFDYTIELNQQMAFNKANPPNIQKAFYISNIDEFIRLAKTDMLGKNLPIYLRILIQARVAVNELERIGIRKWNYKFHPKYKFYRTRKDCKDAFRKNFSVMDDYFKSKVEAGFVEATTK